MAHFTTPFFNLVVILFFFNLFLLFFGISVCFHWLFLSLSFSIVLFCEFIFSCFLPHSFLSSFSIFLYIFYLHLYILSFYILYTFAIFIFTVFLASELENTLKFDDDDSNGVQNGRLSQVSTWATHVIIIHHLNKNLSRK